MIINVTGGPDLSLVEVSEASAIIQEAAHEDANIIFGAVVDPKMEGKVKITVIATGFERPSLSTAGQADGADRDQHADAGRPQLLRLVEAGRRLSGGAGRGADVAVAPLGARDSLGRRASRLRTRAEQAAPGTEFEPVSPLDVPAFLRRQSEG